MLLYFIDEECYVKYWFKTDVFYNCLIILMLLLFMGTVALYVLNINVAWYIPFISVGLSIFFIVYLLSDRKYFLDIDKRVKKRGSLLIEVKGMCRYNGYDIEDCLLCVYQNCLILVDNDNIMYVNCNYHTHNIVANLNENSMLLKIESSSASDILDFYTDSVHLFILYKMLLRVGANFDDEIGRALAI